VRPQTHQTENSSYANLRRGIRKGQAQSWEQVSRCFSLAPQRTYRESCKSMS
jgi:hypothetical protein